MRRVRVTLPAVAAGIGVGIAGIGLALGIHVTVEVVERTDDVLRLEAEGEGAGAYPLTLRHPVVIGMSRIFQARETTLLGLDVRVRNQIPHGVGFGGDESLLLCGMIAANNLLGNPIGREVMLQMATLPLARPEIAAAAMLGGLTTCILHEGTVRTRVLPIASMPIIVVIPKGIANLPPMPTTIPFIDARHNISRVPMLLEGLKTGDRALLAAAFDDQVTAPRRILSLNGWEEMALFAAHYDCALALTGDGGAVLLFPNAAIRRTDIRRDTDKIASLLERMLKDEGIPARILVLPIDTQGVVVSVSQSG